MLNVCLLCLARGGGLCLPVQLLPFRLGQPPSLDQSVNSGVIPQPGVVFSGQLVHAHSSTPVIAAKKSTSARSRSVSVGSGSS